MKFNLVDDILTQTDDSILAVKQVSLAEERQAEEPRHDGDDDFDVPSFLK